MSLKSPRSQWVNEQSCSRLLCFLAMSGHSMSQSNWSEWIWLMDGNVLLKNCFHVELLASDVFFNETLIGSNPFCHSVIWPLSQELDISCQIPGCQLQLFMTLICSGMNCWSGAKCEWNVPSGCYWLCTYDAAVSAVCLPAAASHMGQQIHCPLTLKQQGLFFPKCNFIFQCCSQEI